jgi:hypothetical protein
VPRALVWLRLSLAEKLLPGLLPVLDWMSDGELPPLPVAPTPALALGLAEAVSRLEAVPLLKLAEPLEPEPCDPVEAKLWVPADSNSCDPPKACESELPDWPHFITGCDPRLDHR